jgi:hypothetical protein
MSVIHDPQEPSSYSIGLQSLKPDLFLLMLVGDLISVLRWQYLIPTAAAALAIGGGKEL